MGIASGLLYHCSWEVWANSEWLLIYLSLLLLPALRSSLSDFEIVRISVSVMAYVILIYQEIRRISAMKWHPYASLLPAIYPSELKSIHTFYLIFKINVYNILSTVDSFRWGRWPEHRLFTVTLCILYFSRVSVLFIWPPEVNFTKHEAVVL